MSTPTAVQHWESNQDHFLLCAGYEAFPPGSGVYIELSVTDLIKHEDAGDGQRAGARVAREVRDEGRRKTDRQGRRSGVLHIL